MRATAQRLEFIEEYLSSLLGEDLHVKRVCSLLLAVLGGMTSASLAVAVIGQALAHARGKSGKHAIKQVDSLLSNQGVDPWELFPLWIKDAIGASRDLNRGSIAARGNQRDDPRRPRLRRHEAVRLCRR